MATIHPDFKPLKDMPIYTHARLFEQVSLMSGSEPASPTYKQAKQLARQYMLEMGKTDIANEVKVMSDYIASYTPVMEAHFLDKWLLSPIHKAPLDNLNTERQLRQLRAICKIYEDLQTEIDKETD